MGGATCRKTPISRSTLEKSPRPDTSLKETMWIKAQHEGAMTPWCIIRKNPQVPQTALQLACHLVKNSKGKRRSIPPKKTRPDSLVPTLQRPCDRTQKWTGNLRFLPPFEMKPSSIGPNPVESLRLRQLHSIPHLSEAPWEVP